MKPGRVQSWQSVYRRLKREVGALYLAYRDPRTPWYARLFAALVVAYAISPIDLIPDPIPVLGYLDDLILIPLGVWVALRLIPRGVTAECRQRAAQETVVLPVSRAGAVMVAIVWIVLAGLLFAAGLRLFRGHTAP